MANGFQGPPAADFYSQLSGLGDVIQANRVAQAKKDAIALATQPGPNGTVDYGRAMLGLAGVDPQAAQLFAQAQNHQDTLAQQKITNARAVLESERAQRNADRSFGLQSSNAARTQANADREWNYDPTEERAAQAKANGIDPASPEGKAFILNGTLPDLTPAGGGASLNPIYGVGADGKPAIIQTTKTGKAIQTEIPAGFSISKEPIKVDSGTHFTLLDPQTRQVVGTLPKNLAAVEVEKARGEATGAAEVALPQVIANGNQILKTLNDLEKHPGKDSSVGMYSMLPVIPGTERANFKATMEQLQGQNFLQAYQTLRGGGAITDIEGKKGENAQARMQTAQTKEAFNAALKDFKDVVQSGILRASAKARGPGSASQAAPQGAAPADGMNRTSSGVPWRIQ